MPDVFIDFKGMDDFLKKIEKLPENIDKELLSELDVLGVAWKDRVKLDTPHDTGLLQRSWELDRAKKVGRRIKLGIHNDTEYARHVEYGHRVKGSDTVVEGVYMLKKSKPYVKKMLPRAVKNALRKAGKD